MNKPLGPIILAVVLFLLALGAATLAYLFPSVEEITGVKTTEPSGNRAKLLKAEEIKASLALWDSPVIWKEPTPPHRLFESDEYLFYPSAYPNGDFIKKIGPDTRSPSGVLLSWYRKNGLNFTDPKSTGWIPITMVSPTSSNSRMTRSGSGRKPSTATAPSRRIRAMPRAIPTILPASACNDTNCAPSTSVQRLQPDRRRLRLPAPSRRRSQLPSTTDEEGQRRAWL